MFQIYQITNLFNFLRSIINIGQNVSRGPLYIKMSAKVEFTFNDSKDGQKGILCSILKWHGNCNILKTLFSYEASETDNNEHIQYENIKEGSATTELPLRYLTTCVRFPAG
jgi:hypothetical protein